MEDNYICPCARRKDLKTERMSQPTPLSRRRVHLSGPPELPVSHASEQAADETSQALPLPGSRLRLSPTHDLPSVLPVSRNVNSTLGSSRITRQCLRTNVAVLSRYELDKQASCTLLTGLPLELREQIYSLVLDIDSSTRLHLVSRPNGSPITNATHAITDPSANAIRKPAVVPTYPISPTTIRKTGKAPPSPSLSWKPATATTAKSIRFLYSRPTFDFSHPETLNWFALTIPPARLPLITKLHIALELAPHDPEIRPFRNNFTKPMFARNPGDLVRYWDPAWRTILCEMIGLRYITVEFVGGNYFGSYFDPKFLEPVLRPLLELRGLQEFQFEHRLEMFNCLSEEQRKAKMLERSETLRLIMERAASGAGAGWGKRKAEELDWGGDERRRRRSKRRRADRKMWV